MNYDLDFQFPLNDGRDPYVQNSKVEGQLVIKLQWKQTDRRVDRKVRFDLINVKITFTHNDSSYKLTFSVSLKPGSNPLPPPLNF